MPILCLHVAGGIVRAMAKFGRRKLTSREQKYRHLPRQSFAQLSSTRLKTFYSREEILDVFAALYLWNFGLVLLIINSGLISESTLNLTDSPRLYLNVEISVSFILSESFLLS